MGYQFITDRNGSWSRISATKAILVHLTATGRAASPRTAKILENGDNGRNDHDSSKKVKRLPMKFNDESFSAMKIIQNKFFGGNFTGNEPKIYQK